MFDERYLSQFASHRSQLVRAATRTLGSEAQAEDAVQDSYVRALEAMADNKPQPHSTQAWLSTVMRNLAVDQLRRHSWLQHWLHDAQALALDASSAEVEVGLAQEVEHALRLLATYLSPADGAAVLLREVFEVGYGEIAQTSGKTEASCRQQLHRALLRLRQCRQNVPPVGVARDEGDVRTVFSLYCQSLQHRSSQALFALLQPSVTQAVAQVRPNYHAEAVPKTVCQVVQVGGQLGLVLTLGGQLVCVLPLGAGHGQELAEMEA